MKIPQNINPHSALNQAIRNIIQDNLTMHTSQIDLLMKNMSGFGERREGVQVDIEFAANLLIDEDGNKSKAEVLKEFEQLLNIINEAWNIKI